VLPESTANLIAAGEVVERPASVVKELVENSLDAGASSVEVALEAGGRGLIMVADDGEGMDREDLLLSIERHATSKLSSPDDLEAVRTLGFRGEALPAIASVSLLRITTSQLAASHGWRLEARAGLPAEVEEVAARPGTVVEVRSLFLNTPARRKFLRSSQRETALALEVLTSIALAHPRCGFTFSADGRKTLSVPPCATRKERVVRLLGPEPALMNSIYEGEGIRVESFATGAGDSRSDRLAQAFLVNGRPVRDRMLAHAVSHVYGPVLPPGRHPVAVLYVDIPPEAVDVNMHPSKNEVRFRRPGDVHHSVVEALRGALGQPAESPSASDRLAAPGTHVGTGWFPRALPLEPPHAGPRFSIAEILTPSEPDADLHDVPIVLGHYRQSFILAADIEGLLLVDQHAAHERVLFEELLGGAPRGATLVQPLLSPVPVELGAAQRALLDLYGEGLAGMGFEVEPFGHDAAVVRALPVLFTGCDPGRLLRDVLSDLARERDVVDDPGEPGRFPGETTTERMRRRFAASAACQAAIKINHALTEEKMAWLLRSLASCRVPTTCPHGRPAILRLAHGAIERAFLRS